MKEFWKLCSNFSQSVIVGRIIMTGNSYCLAVATSIILASTSPAWSFPNTSNSSFRSCYTSPILTTAESLRTAFILLSPWSPLKVAVTPITLYLFSKRIEEISLPLAILGVSAKNRESISSTNNTEVRGILSVRKSSYVQ